MPHRPTHVLTALIALVTATGGSPARADVADTIYTGGDILTMRGAKPEYVEALAVKDGRILFVGPLGDAQPHVGPGTTTIDLAGKTLLPGFIDTHGHFVYVGKNLVDADLFGCTDVADLLARTKRQAERTLAKLRAARPDLDRRSVNQALAAIDKAVKKHGIRDARPVFVHASWLRPDQIEKMKVCGAIPSFLPSGIVPGGDSVVKLWGPERAAGAMAARTFLRVGLPFTFSHDAPVSPQPWILALVDAGTNRRSGSGRVVGPDERISPYDGLRAVTATAAYQLKEETIKEGTTIHRIAK